jgi:hypothetical protein
LAEINSDEAAPAPEMTMPTKLQAAQEYLLEVTGELIRNLQTVMNREDDRELDEINNQRQRYAAALGYLAIYFDRVGHDEISEIGRMGLVIRSPCRRGQEAWAERRGRGLGGLEIDQQLKRRGLLHRQIGWLRPPLRILYTYTAASAR